MDLPRNVDDYIKETLDDTLGIPVSSQTLESKLRACQDSQFLLRERLLSLLPQLNQKDQLVERFKSEAAMNARSLKKFVEQNQRLAMECEKLLARCHQLENEVALYDKDMKVLAEFGDEADKRTREAQNRVLDLERDLLFMGNELSKYKNQHQLVNSSSACTPGEQNLLDSLLTTLTSYDEHSTYAFLQVNSENEICKQLLSMWNCINPSTRSVLSLIAKVKSLEKDKEHLRTNLTKAEEEVKLLFDENNVLEKENKRLLRRSHPDSGGEHTNSPSAKSNKRKSSPRTSSPMQRKIDSDDQEVARQPLSPLRHNSPDCRMHKK